MVEQMIRHSRTSQKWEALSAKSLRMRVSANKCFILTGLAVNTSETRLMWQTLARVNIQSCSERAYRIGEYLEIINTLQFQLLLQREMV